MSLEGTSPSASQTSLPRRPPYFFRDEYASLIVKGNFMTLAAKPGLVEDGEWMAHQGSSVTSIKQIPSLNFTHSCGAIPTTGPYGTARQSGRRQDWSNDLQPRHLSHDVGIRVILLKPLVHEPSTNKTKQPHVHMAG